MAGIINGVALALAALLTLAWPVAILITLMPRHYAPCLVAVLLVNPAINLHFALKLYGYERNRRNVQPVRLGSRLGWLAALLLVNLFLTACYLIASYEFGPNAGF